MKDMEREQQEIVKKYLQHRKMLRQTENTMSRAALDTKMLQDANDRVYEVIITTHVPVLVVSVNCKPEVCFTLQQNPRVFKKTGKAHDQYLAISCLFSWKNH